MSKYILEVKNLNKIYSNGYKALDDVSFKIEKGASSGVLGLNGAGKTTMINIIGGLTSKTSGDIIINGVKLEKSNRNIVMRDLAFMPQDISLNYMLTVDEVIRYASSFYFQKTNEDELNYILESLDLMKKRHEKTRNLSIGNQRRVMLAKALIVQPKLLFLDEPTAGIDIEMRERVWDLVQEYKKRGTTLILTTHHMEEVQQHCDHAVLLKNGMIVNYGQLDAMIKSHLGENFFIIGIEDEEVGRAKKIKLEGMEVIDKKIIFRPREDKSSMKDVFAILSKHDITPISIQKKEFNSEDLLRSI